MKNKERTFSLKVKCLNCSRHTTIRVPIRARWDNASRMTGTSSGYMNSTYEWKTVRCPTCERADLWALDEQDAES